MHYRTLSLYVKYCLLLLTCSLLLNLFAKAQTPDTIHYNYGIWQSFGTPASSTTYPVIKGRLVSFNWKDLETSPNVWKWAQFDKQLALRSTDNLPIIFMVYTKEDAPDWLFPNGVPKVIEKDAAGNVTGYSPYYADATYKFYFKRMITTVRQHVETLPDSVRRQIVGIQGCYGSTGDYISYKGKIDVQYQLSDAQFYELFKEFSLHTYNEYKSTAPKIYLLSNPSNIGDTQCYWLINNCPGGWIKTGTIGKGYQLNDEVTKAAWLYKIINEPQNGNFVRARSELSAASLTAGWWLKYPARNMFTLFCYDIYWGLDWNNIKAEQLATNIYDSAFKFLNKYSGQKNPLRSTNAMCALHDGLDASDSVRFPASTYGSVAKTATRFNKILADYTSYGARLEDVTNALGVEGKNLDATGINDVGWNIFTGNYERYLHQLTPNTTSAGYWNVNSSDANSMFGRFARGFDIAKGKNALYFDVDDVFLKNGPLNGQYPLTIDITYLDNNANWQLFYDAKSNVNKQGLSINGTNTGLWKKVSVTLADAYLGNRSASSSDFYIKSANSNNAIFALVELSRSGTDLNKTGFLATTLNAFDTICVNSTAINSFELSALNLSDPTIVIHPLNGYQFSLQSDGDYADSLIINTNSSTFNQIVYVKFAPQVDGNYNGSISITSKGVPSLAVAAKGTAVNSAPTVVTNVTNVSCNGAADGAVDLMLTGGLQPFSFTWDNDGTIFSNQQKISTLKAGTYNATVKAAGGCSTDATVTVSEPQELKAKAETLAQQSTGASTAVTVTALGGTMPYLGTGTFYVATGDYQYEITDANGCKSTANITVEPPAVPLAATASVQNAIKCFGDSTFVTIDATGGTAPYAGTGTFKVAAGTYDYIVTDATGRAVNTNVVIEQPTNKLEIALLPGTINCYGGTTNLDVSASGGTAPYTGTGSFTVTAGTYNYTVTDANGCSSTASVTIDQPASALKATAIAGTINCYGGTTTVTVAASGGTAPCTGTGTFTVTAGTYNYTVTDANGCSSTTSIAIDQPASALKATATAASISCYGSATTVTVAASGGTAPYTGTGTFTVTAGTYNYTVTDANGCSSTASITIDQPASALKATATAGTINCYGGTTIITVAASGGTAPYTGTGIFTVTAGTYNYTVTDANGCSSTTSVTIDQPASALKATATAGTLYCYGGTTTVTVAASGGTAPYTGTGTFSVTAGTYSYTVTDASGCSSTTSIAINQPASALKATATAGIINCYGGTTTVTVSASGGTAPYTGIGTFTVTAGTYNYTVTDAKGCATTTNVTVVQPAASLKATASAGTITCHGGTTTVTVSATGGKTPYTGTGTFTVTAGIYNYTVSDASGCTSTATVNVVQPAAMVLSISSSPILCYGGTTTITVSASGGTPTYTYSLNGGKYQSTNTFTSQKAGSYTIAVKDAKGCTQSQNFTVSQPASAVALAVVSKVNAGCKGGANGSFQVSGTGGTPPYLYKVSTGSYTSATSYGALKAGTYTVTVKDANSCTASTTITIADGTKACTSGALALQQTQINVVASKQLQVTAFPNPSTSAFTLVVEGSSDEKVEILVTDMYGKKLYTTQGSNNQSYTFGKGFAPGVYIATIMQAKQLRTIKLIKGE